MRIICLSPRVDALDQRSARTATIARVRGRELQTIRAAHFREHPLCVHCEARGIARVATELDHIVALINGGLDVASNRQGLCRPCHEAKTAQDMRAARSGG